MGFLIDGFCPGQQKTSIDNPLKIAALLLYYQI